MVQLYVFALVGESGCGPEALADADAFTEALLTLAVVHVIAPKLVARSAPSESDINPSAAEHVQYRDFLR